MKRWVAMKSWGHNAVLTGPCGAHGETQCRWVDLDRPGHMPTEGTGLNLQGGSCVFLGDTTEHYCVHILCVTSYGQALPYWFLWPNPKLWKEHWPGKQSLASRPSLPSDGTWLFMFVFSCVKWWGLCNWRGEEEGSCGLRQLEVFTRRGSQRSWLGGQTWHLWREGKWKTEGQELCKAQWCEWECRPLGWLWGAGGSSCKVQETWGSSKSGGSCNLIDYKSGNFRFFSREARDSFSQTFRKKESEKLFQIFLGSLEASITNTLNQFSFQIKFLVSRKKLLSQGWMKWKFQI